MNDTYNQLNNQLTQKNKTVWENTTNIWCLVALVWFYPLGLIVLWLFSTFTTKQKVVLSLWPFIILFFGLIIALAVSFS